MNDADALRASSDQEATGTGNCKGNDKPPLQAKSNSYDKINSNSCSKINSFGRGSDG